MRLVRTFYFCFLVLGALLQANAAGPSYQFLEDGAEPQFTLNFKALVATTGSLTVVFNWKDANNFYALDLTPASVQLRSVIGGVPHRLQSAPHRWASGGRVTIKRRAWLMEAIVDRRTVLTAYDANLSGGKVGAAGSNGWKWEEPRLQPVEPLYFADDFTREADQKGEWKTLAGEWKLTASSESISGRNAAMSANPFAFQIASPSGMAIAQTGRWFWDNYEVNVAARPAGPGAIGLAVYLQDARNYLAFLWNAREGQAARRLVRVVDGKTTVLAQAPGAFLPRQWFRLGMRTSPGFIEAFIDGEPVLRASSDSFGQGGIGLLAQNIGQANFDDVRVRDYALYRQDFNGPTGGAWAPVGGFWQARQGVLASASVKGDNGKSRFLIAGRDDWSGYEMTASGRIGARGSCGLVAGYKDEKNYALFRWASPQSTLPFRGRQQLLRYRDGKATILNDGPVSLVHAGPDGYAKVRVRLSAGALTVFAGDELVAQTADMELRSGRCGLWSQGVVTVGFRDVVMFFPPEPAPPRVAPKMEADALMVGWASPTGEWPPRTVGGGFEFWNTGEFFGDAVLNYNMALAGVPSSRVEIALRARREEFGSGYIVRIDPVEGKPSLALELLRDGKSLRQAAIDKGLAKGAAKLPLRFELEGRALLVSAAGMPLLSYLEETPPQGTCLALRAGFPLNAQDLSALSEGRDDYTFSDAPVDWYAPQGTWQVISRWPCYSDWSFFGTTGLNPVIWNKRTYSGDTIVEIYAHNQMDLPKDIGYSHPGDLNITLAGDGKNPASGYSFVVAGWDNTRTRILRQTQTVAENAKGYMMYPINHNNAFHKRWYYLRAEARRTQKNGRAGVELILSADNTELCRYFDESPLSAIEHGGRVAFWTVDGTMMIARAKIESANLRGRSLPGGLIDAAAAPAEPARSGSGDWMPQALTVDGLPSAMVEANADSWSIRNPVAGGLFGARLIAPNGQGSSRLTDKSRLNFDIALPANVRVDLYAKVDGEIYCLAITNNQPPDASTPLLGVCKRGGTDPAGPREGGEVLPWQHFTFDLGKALQERFPDTKNWKLDELSIGALHGNPYRWLGFDGNALGSIYHLRNVKMEG